MSKSHTHITVENGRDTEKTVVTERSDGSTRIDRYERSDSELQHIPFVDLVVDKWEKSDTTIVDRDGNSKTYK